ncbi:MAG: hypothetical protein RLZZ338_212, partial [Cyanobacteriota bacterium]
MVGEPAPTALAIAISEQINAPARLVGALSPVSIIHIQGIDKPAPNP